jgi:hypothetical protein
MTGSKFTEGFRFIEAGFKVFEGIGSRVTTSKNQIRKM